MIKLNGNWLFRIRDAGQATSTQIRHLAYSGISPTTCSNPLCLFLGLSVSPFPKSNQIKSRPPQLSLGFSWQPMQQHHQPPWLGTSLMPCHSPPLSHSLDPCTSSATPSTTTRVIKSHAVALELPPQGQNMGIQQCEDLEACLAVAIDVAKKAGQVIVDNFSRAKHVEHKGMVDLVTETDKACEDLIFTQLKLSFPSHELIGEETSAENGIPVLTEAPTWVVDPLDGTTNFVHKFPFVCVSIGLVINKVPVVGVVYNPILSELFTAVQGKGTFLNGTRIHASSQDKIGNALLATEVGTNRDKKTVDWTTNMINNLLFQVRSVRMSGSCAMNLCGVACGRLDMFYELGFGGPWDVAGGALIVQEAGGHVFDPSGGEFDVMSRRIASSNAHLKQALVAGMAGFL